MSQDAETGGSEKPAVRQKRDSRMIISESKRALIELTNIEVSVGKPNGEEPPRKQGAAAPIPTPDPRSRRHRPSAASIPARRVGTIEREPGLCATRRYESGSILSHFSSLSPPSPSIGVPRFTRQPSFS